MNKKIPTFNWDFFWCMNMCYGLLTEQVLIPNKGYNGQKLTKLVKAKTPAATTATKPNVPEIVPL